MRRYGVPRIIFINKLDRLGANPWPAIQAVRSRLKITCASLQIPIGLDEKFQGVVDLLKMKGYYFEGENGEIIREAEIPNHLVEEANAKRNELVE